MKDHCTTLLALLLLSPVVPAMAERKPIAPTDFAPLTSRPWKPAGATLAQVLDAIFHEPNAGIRDQLLGEYLRTLPIAQLSEAFNRSVELEDAQPPDHVVEMFLPIWAERDPQGCWKRTKELFHVVGIGDDWLEFDSWKSRPRIVVQDWSALRASPFWLSKAALVDFPTGVEKSKLPKKERIRMTKEFADAWFAAFGTWPGPTNIHETWNPVVIEYGLNSVFGATLDQLRSYVAQPHDANDALAYEIATRRWLEAEPAAAPAIIQKIQAIKWPSSNGEPRSPSIELLMIWAKADLPGMTHWVESLDRADGLALKGMLMNRVDAMTRERWLAEAKGDAQKEDQTPAFWEEWAKWDPKAALDAVIAAGNAEAIGSVANTAAYGPWYGRPYNTCRFGLRVIRDFDTSRLPESYRQMHFNDWYEILELWGNLDVGETARYGVDFLMHNDYVPREGLIRFFSGEEIYPDEGGMIDRTFCALRVWAVFKPAEVKAWIGTQKDPKLRRALTWLLQHPWGEGPKE